jgi:hypothetical protein
MKIDYKLNKIFLTGSKSCESVVEIDSSPIELIDKDLTLPD